MLSIISNTDSIQNSVESRLQVEITIHPIVDSGVESRFRCTQSQHSESVITFASPSPQQHGQRPQRPLSRRRLPPLRRGLRRPVVRHSDHRRTRRRRSHLLELFLTGYQHRPSDDGDAHGAIPARIRRPLVHRREPTDFRRTIQREWLRHGGDSLEPERLSAPKLR